MIDQHMDVKTYRTMDPQGPNHMNSRRELLKTLGLGGLGLSLGGALNAQTVYPNKPIKYIVPVSAGGGSDMVGRTVCERWGKALGQTIVVENQGGGGGVIACQNTARAPADGYTLMQGYVATLGTSPATRKNLPYDPIKDFTPIGMIGGTPNVLVVNTQLPAQNFAEFLSYIKKNPGRVSYGSAGQGSLTHLTMELFKMQVQSFLVHIPYRGVAPAFTDLMGGQTQAMFPGLAAALPHIRSGRVRPLAITGSSRHPQLKDTPTMEELGFKGFDALQWYGVCGPAAMPAAIVKTLNESLNGVLKAPDFKEKLSVEAVEPMPMSSEQFSAYIKKDLDRWTHLAKDRHIELDS
jgi:tripartite-type tricarboxylate transporter receptor subunit TctC